MSARLFIFVQIFHQLLVRRKWRSAVSPNFETECADSADDRQNCAEQKPDRDGHVLRRFSIFGAVTKRTSARLLRHQQDRSAYAQGYGPTSDHKNGQKLFHVMI